MDKIITRAKGAAAERKVKIEDIEVPDLWHVAMRLKKAGQVKSSEMVLETWYLAHDLIRHIKEGPGKEAGEDCVSEPEDHSDDICSCGDPDCNRPFGHN